MYWGWYLFATWIFWILLIAVFFSLATPVPRSTARRYRETPLDVLQRRYAEGELTTEEYEERRMRLERDLARRPAEPATIEPERRPTGQPGQPLPQT